MVKNCNNCPSLHKMKLSDNEIYTRCLKTNKCINPYCYKEALIQAPIWCPKVPIEEKEKHMQNQITPITIWGTIKPNEIYHIPPYGILKRHNIKIVYVGEKYFTYTKVGEYGINYAYPSDVLPKVMVKLKNTI